MNFEATNNDSQRENLINIIRGVREKIEQHAKIGNKVIINRGGFPNGTECEIVDVHINQPMDEEYLATLKIGDPGEKIPVPTISVRPLDKVKYPDIIVDHLVSSEWEPAE